MEGTSTKQTARKSSGKSRIPKNNSSNSVRESSIDSNASCSNDSFFNDGSVEKDKNDKITRELQQLRFHNPGRYNADLTTNRLKRRDEARRKTNTVPQYNAKGQLSYDNDVFERICDCFNKECPGCFRSCKKCGSRMCGVVCQINRKLIPFKTQEQGAGGQVIKNPQMGSRFVSKLRNSSRPLVFGMLHVPALPGTPLSKLSINEIEDKVKHEASIYSKTKIDGLILENMFDLPYVMRDKVGPEVTASMTRLSLGAKNVFDSKKKSDVLFGIQILAGANSQALAVAHVSGLDFIRSEGFVFAHVADEGFMDGCAGSLLRYRKAIGAENIAIITDIKKKHSSHSITSDISVGDTAHAAEFFLSDGVIITGNATGDPANVKDIREAKKDCSLPVLVGSGVTIDNLSEFLEADGLIIGSHFKENGHWENELVQDKIDSFMDKILNI